MQINSLLGWIAGAGAYLTQHLVLDANPIPLQTMLILVLDISQVTIERLYLDELSHYLRSTMPNGGAAGSCNRCIILMIYGAQSCTVHHVKTVEKTSNDDAVRLRNYPAEKSVGVAGFRNIKCSGWLRLSIIDLDRRVQIFIRWRPATDALKPK